MARGVGDFSISERAKFEIMYTSEPAAYGSARNLYAITKRPKAKMILFCNKRGPYTDKFLGLKVKAYDSIGIW